MALDDVEPWHLDGWKQIAGFLSEAIDRDVSAEMARVWARRPIDALPVHRDTWGRVHAMKPELEAWVRRSGLVAQRPRPLVTG